LVYTDIEVYRIEVTLILLIQMATICDAKAKPTSRINLYTAQDFNRIVIECVWRVATRVHRRANLSHWLEVLIDRKVEADARKKFIRPIERNTVCSLWIAIQDVPDIS
jgi:hypothetical protein